MGLTPSDLLTVTLLVTFAVALGAAVYFRLLGWHRSRSPRLRLLTGTRSQHAAIVLAVRPVVRELIPGLEAAGLEIGSIALLPTLAGSAGEPLQEQVEHVNGTRSFIIRLAHMVGGTLRRPEEVAGALAEELLYLYHEAAAVTIVRQTPSVASLAVPAQNGMARKPVGRNGLAILPHPAGQEEAEGTVIAFKASPLGPRNGQSS